MATMVMSIISAVFASFLLFSSATFYYYYYYYYYNYDYNNDKVNRCLARYSPRATTTNRPTTGH